MIVLGIDPGLTGAIAFLRPDGARVFDLPTRELPGNGTVKRRVDARGLYQLLMAHAGGDNVLCTIEELSTGGTGQGRGNAMTIGSQYRTRGQIEATLELVGVDAKAVTPIRWKRMYGLAGKAADDQATAKAIALARQLYPELEHDVKLVKHHNRAEAVLIAHWAKKGLEVPF